MSVGEYLLCGGARLPRETLQDCERFKLAWFMSHSLFCISTPPPALGPIYGPKSCLDSHSWETVGCNKCVTARTDSYRNSCYSSGKCLGTCRG